MSKYYYNGVLLPEIPADVTDTKWVILHSPKSNTYTLYGSTTIWYFYATSNYPSTIKNVTGYCRMYSIASDGESWELRSDSTGDWLIVDTETSQSLFWSNHDIPNGSATATDIYFRGSFPTATPIHLVNQNQASSNSTTTCSLTMAGCKVGNTLILAYAVRGNGNDPTLSDGWVKLGGGNNVDTVDGLNQRLYFAYKVVTTESETVTLTQTTTGRIYMVCSEYSEVTSVVMRDDLASFGSSNYTVTGSKSNANDVMVYGVTSAYYSSGRLQTVTPTDLMKIEGDSSAERLACWFDNGSGAVNHTFYTVPNQAEANCAILECVQLFSSVPDVPDSDKYLIQSGDSIFTVTDGVLTAVDGSLTAELFRTYGVDEIPSSDLLVTLTDPIVYYWTNTDEITPLVAMVQGVPFPQTLESEDYDMTDETILGIETVIVDASDDCLFAVSFDSGQTWKLHTGENWATLSEGDTGMSPSVLSAIPTEDWNSEATTGKFRFRVTIPSSESYLNSLVVDYLN
jgi:hypothetical protein